MFGFNPYAIIGALAAAMASFLFGLWKGYSYEHEKFMAFKTKVAQEAKAQEVKIDSIKKQNDLVTEGVKNEYEAKIAAIRNYYASIGVRYTGSSGSKMPGLSPTSPGFDAATAYPILAGQCTETTLMLVSLQDWIRLQTQVK